MSKENDPSRLHCRRQIDSGMTSSDGADSMDDYVLVPHDDAAVIDAVAVPHSDEDDISNDISDEDDRLTTVSLGSWRDVGVFHENTSSYEDFADLSEFIHHSCSESDEEASDSYNSTTAQPIHVEDHGGDISTAIIVDDESHIDNNNSGVEAHYHHQDDEADSGHDQSHHESHHESNESHHESNESQRRHHDSTSNILDASDPPEETDKFKKFHGATVRRRGHDYRHLCSSDISVRRENTKQQCARFSVERSFFFVSAEDGSIEKKFFSSRLTTQTSITPVTALDLKYPSRFKFFSNGSYYHSATTTWGRRFDFEILDKMLREFSVSEPIIQRHHRSGLDDRPVTEGIYELPIVGYQVRTLNEDDLREAMFRTRGYRCRQRPKGPPSHHPLDVYRCIRPSNPRSSSSYVLLGRLDNSTSAPTKVPELGAQMKCPSKQRSKYWRHPFDTVENGWSEWATFDFGSDRILCAVSSMPCLSLKIIGAGSKRRWQCIDDSRSQWADRIMLQTRRDRGKEWIGRGNFATAGNAWSESVMALNDTADKKGLCHIPTCSICVMCAC